MHRSLTLFFLLFIVSVVFASSYDPHNNISGSYEIDGFVAERSSCKGLDSSAVRYVVSGGMAPYNISWRQLAAPVDEGSATLTNDTDSLNITGLNSAANYVFTIIDASVGTPCVDTFNFTTMGSLGVDPLLSRPTCNGFTDGEATAIILIGNQIYNPMPNEVSYIWSNGDTNSTASGLGEGSYSIVIETREGCTAFNGFGLSAPGAIVIDDTIESISCPGGSDAEIVVQPSGGTPSSGNIPYTIQWSESTTDPYPDTLSSLAAGTYDITVTDANGCQQFDSFTISDPIPVSVQFTGELASSCSRGVCDGQAIAMATGGGAPGSYNYMWATGENTPNASLLCAGWNVVEVENNGCPVVLDSVLITSPNDVVIQAIDSSDASCYNEMDGTIQVSAVGGTPGGYTYMWADNTNGPSRSGLAAGEYSVLATDINGCESDSLQINIAQPDSLELVVDLGSTLNPRCSDSDNGILSVRWIRGGNQNTTPNYAWSNIPNPPNNSVVTNLPPGTYSVTITDGLGCQDSTSYTLTAPPSLIGIIPSPAEPQCFGQLTTVTVDNAIGGSGNSFTFSVNNGPQNQLQFPAEVLAGDSLIISVFDQNSCRFDTTLFIDQPDEIVVTIIDQEVNVDLGASEELSATISNSIPISSIQWSPDIELSHPDSFVTLVTPSQSRTYEIEVIDENGCTGSGQVFVNLNRNRNVYIPNAFSPNGDGINDFFQLSTGIGVRQVKYLRIFDRWGSMVYEQENYLPGDVFNDGWNGKLKGKNLNAGVFVYLAEIEFIDNSSLLFRGDLALVR
ncbi:MAG: gliding motility-associated C-terminal domain-containing protein [Bacteroidia bacterium]|nr:gliding motility-associated C-terminal domain-containing protein [Bacteroidia bacterium]